MNPMFAKKKQGPPQPPPFLKKAAAPGGAGPGAGAPGPGGSGNAPPQYGKSAIQPADTPDSLDEEQDPMEPEPDQDEDDAGGAGQLMPAEKALFMKGTDTCGNCKNYQHLQQTCDKVDPGEPIQPDDRCFVFFEPGPMGGAGGDMGDPNQGSLFGDQQ